MELQKGFDEYTESYRFGWRPDPRLSVTDWADKYRYIGDRSGLAAEKWKTSTTPFSREIMDCLGPRNPAKRVVVMAGTQITKTEMGNNWLGFIMHQSPGPILILRPTLEDARRFSTQRLEPMLNATPVLRGLVKPARSRDGGNTTTIKEFPGGVMFLVGSNSVTGLKSMPIRYLFCDEIDEYPGDVDGQGDPIALAEKRQSGPMHARRKVFLASTPTVKGLSRIEKEFQKSDQRRFFIPCPHCANMDWIRWENIRWETDDNKKLVPGSVELACVECGGLIQERYKLQALPGGEWKPTAEGDGETVGFHLSALYSPLGWFPWDEAVKEFLAAQTDIMRLKTWVNTVLGETWEERGDSVDPDSLLARAERYGGDVPTGVGILVASVDVQGDRLECQVKGYGASEESWLIAFSQFHGDPSQHAVWDELDLFLRGTFTHENGQEVPITCTAVDSGGNHTEQVYQFCATRGGRRIFAIKGGTDRGKPLVARPSRHNRYRLPLFVLCVDTGKETVYSRLKVADPGPGYCHLPEWVEPEYAAQLTAEKAVRKWKKGRGVVRDWIKTRARNEALDLEVYCLAALNILGPTVIRSLPERANALARSPKEPSPESGSAPPGPRRQSWIGGATGR